MSIFFHLVSTYFCLHVFLFPFHFQSYEDSTLTFVESSDVARNTVYVFRYTYFDWILVYKVSAIFL